MSDFKPKYGDEILSVEGRISFPSLDKVDSGNKNSTGKYGLTLLVDKEVAKGEEFTNMMAALANVAGVESVADVEKHPFCNADGSAKDGDAGKNASKPGYPGCIFMKVNSKFKPECFTSIDVEEPEVIDPTNIKPGDYAKLILTPMAYDEGQTTFLLKAVMLTKVGERLTGGGAAATSNAKALFASAVNGGSKAPTPKTTGTKKSSINDILG